MRPAAVVVRLRTKLPRRSLRAAWNAPMSSFSPCSTLPPEPSAQTRGRGTGCAVCSFKVQGARADRQALPCGFFCVAAACQNRPASRLPAAAQCEAAVRSSNSSSSSSVSSSCHLCRTTGCPASGCFPGMLPVHGWLGWCLQWQRRHAGVGHQCRTGGRRRQLAGGLHGGPRKAGAAGARSFGISVAHR